MEENNAFLGEEAERKKKARVQLVGACECLKSDFGRYIETVSVNR